MTAASQPPPEPGPVSLPPIGSRTGHTVPECHGDVCITCSDQAVPVRVLSVGDHGFARVDTGQGVEEVSIALVEAGPGDVVLVHAREAIAVVGERVDGDARG